MIPRISVSPSCWGNQKGQGAYELNVTINSECYVEEVPP
jgi:hypothetical protein